MVCKHAPGDPNCGSTRAPAYYAGVGPNADQYEVLDFYRTGLNIALKVRYTNLPSYEGTKVLIFSGVTEADLIRWRRVDPSFSDRPRSSSEAPSPLAIFPATDKGWALAKAVVNNGLE
jgi:hypothetical protein